MAINAFIKEELFKLLWKNMMRLYFPLLDRQAHKDYVDIVFFLLNLKAKPWESAGQTSGLPISN
jgi:hypothetical protein